jgi:hypothetical protein
MSARQERVAFESWARSTGRDTSRLHNSPANSVDQSAAYKDEFVQMAWLAWQARAGWKPYDVAPQDARPDPLITGLDCDRAQLFRLNPSELSLTFKDRELEWLTTSLPPEGGATKAGMLAANTAAIYARLSDYGVMVLYGEIDREAGCWNFDEAQADPVHTLVSHAGIIAEYERRGLHQKEQRDAATRAFNESRSGSVYFKS